MGQEIRTDRSVRGGETVYLYFKVSGLPDFDSDYSPSVSYELIPTKKEEAVRIVKF